MLAFVITVVLGYGLDRLTKIWVERTIPLNYSVGIIPRYLSFTHFENAGAAFSLLQGRLLLFIVVGVLASADVVMIAVRNRKANSTGM